MREEEIKSTYLENGYVVVRNIISDPELDPLRGYISKRVDEYAREKLKLGKLKSLHENESFERRLAVVCEELSISNSDFKFFPFPSNICQFAQFGQILYDLYNHPEILRIVRTLLGPEVTNHGIPAGRSKLPGSTATSFPWHQDSHYYNEPVRGTWKTGTEQLHVLTVWVPLVDASIENGCLWIIPGSHRWGLLKGARSEDHIVRMKENVETRGNPTPFPLKVGDALFLTNLTVHTSKLNKTKYSRWSIDFRYHATPTVRSITPPEREAAENLNNKARSHGREPLIVLTDGHKPSWEEWYQANKQLQ